MITCTVLNAAPFSYRNITPSLYDFFVTVRQMGIKGI